ncbi:MAG: EVE domain-containing protein [Myxococcota bacterium]
MTEKRYWLMKSEPSVFSYDALTKEPKRTAMWDGVRNYQARNLLRDAIKKGDQVLFYHSNEAPIGVVGVCEVVKEGYPDPTQFDAKQKYYDAKSKPENPRWFVVDVKAKRKLPRVVTLQEIKDRKSLASMKLVQKGQRLSVQPVTKKEYETILAMAEKEPK